MAHFFPSRLPPSTYSLVLGRSPSRLLAVVLNNNFMKSNPPAGMCHLSYVSCFYNFFKYGIIFASNMLLSGTWLEVDFENFTLQLLLFHFGLVCPKLSIDFYVEGHVVVVVVVVLLLHLVVVRLCWHSCWLLLQCICTAQEEQKDSSRRRATEMRSSKQKKWVVHLLFQTLLTKSSTAFCWRARAFFPFVFFPGGPGGCQCAFPPLLHSCNRCIQIK